MLIQVLILLYPKGYKTLFHASTMSSEFGFLQPF